VEVFVVYFKLLFPFLSVEADKTTKSSGQPAFVPRIEQRTSLIYSMLLEKHGLHNIKWMDDTV
jgi:hypothetical protein